MFLRVKLQDIFGVVNRGEFLLADIHFGCDAADRETV